MFSFTIFSFLAVNISVYYYISFNRILIRLYYPDLPNHLDHCDHRLGHLDQKTSFLHGTKTLGAEASGLTHYLNEYNRI